ncbi:major facilitator superfamily domain-containing protein [Apiospora kogelbergensis]|uniref:major facilitator superfamily domain-containing protein n=1 Tax=Apiospora kogelbergensis TaxID=1337665 RepID=UPI00312D8A79
MDVQHIPLSEYVSWESELNLQDSQIRIRNSNDCSILVVNGAEYRIRTECMDREEVASQIIAALATAKREPVEAALGRVEENIFQQQMTKEDEAKLVKKMDLHILPIIILMYLCCFMDRINIGNARLYGLEEELGMHGHDFPLAVSCLFVTYVLGITPASLLVKKIKPRRFIPILAIGWGVVSSCIGFVRTKTELFLLRLLLGLFEAGYFATVCLYFTFFYRRRELGKRISYLFATTAFAGSIAGLLGYGIGSLDRQRGLRAWRWLMIIEGTPSIVLGLISYFVLADTPEEATYLTEREKSFLGVRRYLDGTNLGVSDSQGIIQWDQCFAAWTDWKVWTMAAAQVGVASMLYSYSSFLPTIIKGMGFGALTSQLLSIPCYFFGALTYLLAAFLSDRLGHRGGFVVGACLCSIAGYATLLGTGHQPARIQFIGCLVVAGGLFVAVGMPISWSANNLPSHYKRAAGQGTIQMVGNLAGVYSPFLYLPQYGPRFVVGHSFTVGSIFYAAILFAYVSYRLRRENHRRARGERDYLLEGRSQEDINQLGDRHPWYRYID